MDRPDRFRAGPTDAACPPRDFFPAALPSRWPTAWAAAATISMFRLTPSVSAWANSLMIGVLQFANKFREVAYLPGLDRDALRYTVSEVRSRIQGATAPSRSRLGNAPVRAATVRERLPDV
jgi:hypothetical protein